MSSSPIQILRSALRSCTLYLREAYRPGIRVNGPYYDLDELLTVIPSDIAIVVAQMVRQNADIRRRLYKGIPKTT